MGATITIGCLEDEITRYFNELNVHPLVNTNANSTGPTDIVSYLLNANNQYYSEVILGLKSKAPPSTTSIQNTNGESLPFSQGQKPIVLTPRNVANLFSTVNAPLHTDIVNSKTGFLSTQQANNNENNNANKSSNRKKVPVKVLVNGGWIGMHESGETLLHALKKIRKAHPELHEMSVRLSYDACELDIFTDCGRMLRPLMVVKNGPINISKLYTNEMLTNDLHQQHQHQQQQLLSLEYETDKKQILRGKHYRKTLSFTSLIQSGVVEMIHSSEEDNIVVSLYPSFLHNDTNLKNNVKNEENNGHQLAYHNLLAIPRRYTHCELHPSLALGCTVSVAPFNDFNQAPRNTYQAAMSKQAAGVPASNWYFRTDTTTLVLDYPQKALVATNAMKINQFQRFPTGQNAIVAINAYSYNQEDAVSGNKSSIQRGFMTTCYYYLYITVELVHSPKGPQVLSNPERIEIPPVEIMSKPPSFYSKLDADGIVCKGTRVSPGDALIGKTACISAKVISTTRTTNGDGTNGDDGDDDGGGNNVDNYDNVTNVTYNYTSTPSTLSQGKPGSNINAAPIGINRLADDRRRKELKNRKDVSIFMRTDKSEGVVDNVWIFKNGNNTVVKVRILETHKPQIGDKVASRHGQKGTFGMMYSQEDMPFSSDTSMSPDIMINPHAIPSRMTIGQFMESMAGKAGALNGTIMNGTAFSGTTSKTYEKILREKGFIPLGHELMRDGRTGREMAAQLFMGPVYYNVLKHMVHNKMHARSTGPVQALTRQPVEGRFREGGLRFGEMERDCIIAHGAAGFLQDLSFSAAAVCKLLVCGKCGLFVDQTATPLCRACNSNTSLSEVIMPHASKLLLQELMAMNMVMRCAVDAK
jgi:DNA-directed RNA polymerase II subunit RPB2